MKVAFHFNADLECFRGYYGTPITETCFRILLAQDPSRVHFRIFCGDLLISDYILRDAEKRDELMRGLLRTPCPLWQSLHPDFSELMLTHRIYVLVFEGIGNKICDVLHTSLEGNEAYLGAQQVHETNPIHWVLYGASLVPSYRLLGNELRLLYSVDEKDTRDEGMAEHWRKLPFSSVTFEDLVVRYTIFDTYNSYEHACRVADLSETLVDHLDSVADQVLLRLSDIAPQLADVLYSAFQRLEHLETSEDLAQASLTCRRILKYLADVVYPPRKELVEGRRVGDKEYRNRLWAYISDCLSGREKELLLAELNDIGGRVEKLDALANKGIHDKVSLSEARRLLLGEVILLYDILILSPPPMKSIVPPDKEILMELTQGMDAEYNEDM
jgi:hypothetical protein